MCKKQAQSDAAPDAGEDAEQRRLRNAAFLAAVEQAPPEEREDVATDAATPPGGEAGPASRSGALALRVRQARAGEFFVQGGVVRRQALSRERDVGTASTKTARLHRALGFCNGRISFQDPFSAVSKKMSEYS